MCPTVHDRKTQPTDGDVEAYLAAISNDARRADARAAITMFQEVTGATPRMWGPSIVGFGVQRYATADGRVRESLAVGLAARSTALALYGLAIHGSDAATMSRLGRHTTGKGCLYITKLGDVDHTVLRELIAAGWAAKDHAD